MDKKTPMQIQIELAVTNGRSYSKVPYINLRDERKLKQWLFFSRVRMYRTYHDEKEKDETPLFPYVLLYAFNEVEKIRDSFKRKIKKFKEEIPFYLLAMIIEMDDLKRKTKTLEAKLHFHEQP